MDKSVNDFERIWNDSRECIENSVLISELENRLTQFKSGNSYSVSFLENISEGDKEFNGSIFSELMEMSKEKLLYIDIWSVWCGPCRAEIPHLIDMHDKLKNENIEFISLCCKSDKEGWLKLIKDNNIPGKHYFLDKPESDLLRTRLKFQGFPTYMIIKDGKIIDADAERPSSGEKIIKRLLEINSR